MRPRAISRAPLTLVHLDPTSRTPLHRQIYTDLRNAITAGRLVRGTQIPAARIIALELGVSRQTVSIALDQLRAEGYVETRERSGTFVSSSLPDELLTVKTPRSARGIVHTPLLGTRVSCAANSRTSKRIPGRAPGKRLPFQPFCVGLPALDVFPWTLWARLMGRRLRSVPRSLTDYSDPLGYAPLRAAIAAYVSAARGVVCTPEQVIVTQGARQGLDLVAQLLITPGAEVWMEEPGYVGARTAFASVGARLVPIPIDAGGLSVCEGVRRAPHARVVYVTPSHQHPIGVSMTAARRLELLRWARASGAWIIEDDYDSEFRYASRPLPSLQGLDDAGCVVYVGSFSKTLFSSLRIGYLIVPTPLVDKFAAAYSNINRYTPAIEHAALTDFILGGHFARHVRRMRLLYQERRDALLQGVRDVASPHLELGPADAGMHVVGWLSQGISDRDVTARAATVGVEVRPLSQFTIQPPTRGGLLLGFAAFPPSALRQAIGSLAMIIAKAHPEQQ